MLREIPSSEIRTSLVEAAFYEARKIPPAVQYEFAHPIEWYIREGYLQLSAEIL